MFTEHIVYTTLVHITRHKAHSTLKPALVISQVSKLNSSSSKRINKNNKRWTPNARYKMRDVIAVMVTPWNGQKQTCNVEYTTGGIKIKSETRKTRAFHQSKHILPMNRPALPKIESPKLNETKRMPNQKRQYQEVFFFAMLFYFLFVCLFVRWFILYLMFLIIKIHLVVECFYGSKVVHLKLITVGFVKMVVVLHFHSIGDKQLL